MKAILDKALRVDRQIRAGYMTAFILLFVAYAVTYLTTSNLLEQNKTVNHTNNVIINLETVYSTIKGAESSIRGYLVSNDEYFLRDYSNGCVRLDSLYSSLDSLKLTAEQKVRLDTLRSRMQQRYDTWDAAIDSFNHNNATISKPYLVSLIAQSKTAMTSIRASINEMQQAELGFVKTKQNEVSSSSEALRIINATSLIIALILAVYSIITYNKENKAKREADKKALLYRNQLEERIEELNQLNQELVSLKSIEKFASTGRIARTIAHEVRNPLTNISLASEQLRGEITESEETDLLLEMINRNTTRINSLITDLLNSTKFAQLEFKTVSIDKLLDDTLDFAKDRIELKGITVHKNYAAEPCEVEVDEEKMKIAFLNIIVNAIEAMEAGKGVLTITTENRKNKSVITISDNGSGITEEYLARLFEPYFSSKAKGTGLGLTNTQNIILNHKGNIQAESEVGKGTTFTITLNCTNAEV